MQFLYSNVEHDLSRRYSYATLPSIIVFHDRNSIMSRHQKWMNASEQDDLTKNCPDIDLVYGNISSERPNLFEWIFLIMLSWAYWSQSNVCTLLVIPGIETTLSLPRFLLFSQGE